MLPAIEKDLLISVPNQGIEVKFAPKLIEEVRALKRAAREYYYPMMALKHLRALSSGLMGKTNVFIPNIKDFKTNSFQRVVVFVPGIKATVERRQNGSLVVTEFKMSDGYDEIAKRSKERPGVYTVRRGQRSELIVNRKANGRISTNNDRNVIIADTRYTSSLVAAKTVISHLDSTYSRDVVRKGDFDLFYSPVGNKLGSLTSYTPAVHTKSYVFAGLLADAMERSKKQQSVTWISERSGSVVLTQALQTLALKDVLFDGQNHRVKMHGPTTSPASAFYAIKKVKMVADQDLAMGDGHVRAFASGLKINAARARDDKDDYSWRDYANDLSGGTIAALGAMGAISFAAGATVSSPLIGPVATLCGGAGAIHLACKTFGKYLKR